MTSITLLPGWAMATATMEPLRGALQERLPQTRVDCHGLPAMQMSSIEPDLAQLADELAPGVLVGWSLGGTLALQLMRRFPERFCAVVTLASNASFVCRKTWPDAMPAETFKTFYNDFRDEPEQILKRFASLVTQGSEQARQLRKTLKFDDAGHEQRLHALALLGVLDSRAMLARGTVPLLHCLAGRDALVPAAVAKPLAELDPGATVVVHPQASHALPLEQPLWVAEQIAGFVQARHA
ncbi:MAG TPA: alpha/beta fold hydrolase [Pseudomonas xinjiangensis]|uniref:Alpha/beta fold hydrolase n=2 Tax=root TaxID=1 RepID=A0A7V1FRH1_9GAMM|nr:alpha/beta fold hydrolase [Halopseudomonas xinjiangensis]HEC49167.1 alpha/beta fold hydrolase [Halopseudomonas xinjiangensis]